MSNTFPVQHNVILSDQWTKLSSSAHTLYMTLCQLSNRYGKKEHNGWFGRSIHELILDTGLSNKSITKGKRELITAYMIQEYKEPNYIIQISNKYRIIKWNKVRIKWSSYRNNSPSTYRKKYTGLNKNTKVQKLPVKSKLVDPD